jgi:hypothetical protein
MVVVLVGAKDIGENETRNVVSQLLTNCVVLSTTRESTDCAATR